MMHTVDNNTMADGNGASMAINEQGSAMVQSTSSWTSTVLSTTESENAVTDMMIQRLFRVFLTFSGETADRADGKLNINTNQANWLCMLIDRRMPRNDQDVGHVCACEIEQHLTELCTKEGKINFRHFLVLLGRLFPDRDLLEPAVRHLFDRFVSQVLRKCGEHESSRYLWHLRAKNKSGSKEYTFGCLTEVDCARWIAAVNLAIRYRRRIDLLQFDRQGPSTASTALLSHSACRTTEPVVVVPLPAPATTAQNSKTDRLLAWRLALESDNLRLTELLNKERQAVKDEELVRALATRMLDDERVRREKFEKLSIEREHQLNQEKAVRRKMIDDAAKRDQELASLRLKLDDLTLQDAATARVQQKTVRPELRNREKVLLQLKRDQEALSDYQRQLKDQVLEHQKAQKQFYTDSKQVLNRLLDNSRRRCAVSNGSNNTPQLRVVSPEIHTVHSFSPTSSVVRSVDITTSPPSSV